MWEINLLTLFSIVALHMRSFKVLSLNFVLKLLAKWRMQNLWQTSGSVHPEYMSLTTTIMSGWRSDISHYPFLCVTPTLIHAKNQLQLFVFSHSVMANANGNNWLLPSHPIAISKVPLYFPYKCVPSILRTSWQWVNLLIDGANAKKHAEKFLHSGCF